MMKIIIFLCIITSIHFMWCLTVITIHACMPSGVSTLIISHFLCRDEDCSVCTCAFLTLSTLSKKLMERNAPLHIGELLYSDIQSRYYLLRWCYSLSPSFQCAHVIKQVGKLSSLRCISAHVIKQVVKLSSLRCISAMLSSNW